MINSKIASLEARIARLESSLNSQNRFAANSVMDMKSLLSLMSKVLEHEFRVDKVSNDFAKGTFDAALSLYKDLSISAPSAIFIDFKIELKDTSSSFSNGGYLNDALYANFSFSKGGRIIQQDEILLNDSVSEIAKKLKKIDALMERIANSSRF